MNVRTCATFILSKIEINGLVLAINNTMCSIGDLLSLQTLIIKMAIHSAKRRFKQSRGSLKSVPRVKLA